MADTPLNDRAAMTGNVQGFELPMGCLMTSVFILLPILTMATGLISANSLSEVVSAVAIPALVIAGFALLKRTAPYTATLRLSSR